MRLWRTWAGLLIVAIAVAFAGSVIGGSREGDKSDRPWEGTIALRQILEGAPVMRVPAAVWTDVRAFYEQRDGRAAWVNAGNGNTSRVVEALEILRTAPEHGFAPEDYGVSQVGRRLEALEQSDKDAPARGQRLAELDAYVTTALLALGRDVAMGRVAPQVIDRRAKSRRAAPDFVAALTRTIDGDLNSWLDSVRPQHPEYTALQLALTELKRRQQEGAWPKVPVEKFTAGGSSPSVVVLRQRLTAGGYLSGAASANASPAYDADVEDGVRAFQNLHGITATGVADATTIAAMNVPIEDRIRQIALNLERWRWVPDDLGARHLLVNIPQFHVVAREQGKTVMDMRVIVGKADNHKTPFFSSEMTTVVFSPYWNIPDSIVQGETAPAIARDPDYLSKNDIEILRVSKSGAAPVDASSVNWGDSHEVRQLAFRQRPGPRNSLGYVKFLFPNDFDVYLHDTPSDNLFERRMRALSHGCVRIEEPEALAKYILRGYPEWDETRILDAMHAGVEKHVKLKERIPVHIVYFTAWADDNGGVHFEPDVYGYDAVQARQRAASVSAAN